MSTKTIEAEANDIEVVTPQTALIALEKAALSQLSAVDAGLAKLRRQYRNKVYDVSTTEGMDNAKKARMDIRDRRYKVPKIVAEQKAAIKAVAEKVDNEGDRIIAVLLELETPIHEQIKGEEDRKAAAKEAKEREAREAKERVEAVIASILAKPADVVGRPFAEMAAAIKTLEDMPVTLEEFGDHAGRVEAVKSSTIERIEAMHAAAVAHAKEAQALAESRAALAADRERMDREDKERREQREREQREHDERMATQRAEADRITAAAKAQADAIELQAAQQREQAERIERERQQRADDIQRRIAAISELPAKHAASSAAAIAVMLVWLDELQIVPDYFDGRTAEALAWRVESTKLLAELRTAALQRELDAAAEAQRQRDEAAKAEAQRASDEAKAKAATKLYDALVGLLACQELSGTVSTETATLIETANAAIAAAVPTNNA